MRKAEKPFSLPTHLVRQIKFTSPNIYELNTIASALNEPHIFDDTELSISELFATDSKLLKKVNEAAKHISSHIDNIIVTLGSNGVLVVRQDPRGFEFFNARKEYVTPGADNLTISSRYYKIASCRNVVNVSGAGDCFNSGFIAAMIRGLPEDICVSVGQECANQALQSQSPVPETLFPHTHQCWQEKSKFKAL